MDGLTYILDTNAISDYITQFEPTTTHIRQAAQFWAVARNAGRQLFDVDLLIAALAFRLNTVVVTNDNDFNALPVRHENWRK
jgi:predicted nucleic acid-binding protein